MFTKQSTKAIILNSYNRDEADKVFKILTEEYGLIYALAKGIRNEKSKLRYSLSHYNLVQIEIIQSKNGWRLTGVEIINQTILILRDDSFQIFVKACSFCEKLIYGQVPDKELYLIFERYLGFIRDNSLDPNDLKALEGHWKLNLLKHMGYLNLNMLNLNISTALKRLNLESINNLLVERKKILGMAEEILEGSHLS